MPLRHLYAVSIYFSSYHNLFKSNITQADLTHRTETYIVSINRSIALMISSICGFMLPAFEESFNASSL